MKYSIEQKARDFLTYLGVTKAQNFTAGDVLELAEFINRYYLQYGDRPGDPTAEKITVPVQIDRDIFARMESFKELTGMPVDEILRRGGIEFINDWHLKKQNSYNDQDRQK